jgi:hypothetical protein
MGLRRWLDPPEVRARKQHAARGWDSPRTQRPRSWRGGADRLHGPAGDRRSRAGRGGHAHRRGWQRSTPLSPDRCPVRVCPPGSVDRL